MLFNSITFVIFLVIVFTLYWAPFTKTRIHQNLILLISSYVFYGWWDVRFLSLIVISSLCDFYLGRLIYEAKDHKRRRLFLIGSLVVNLGILFTFKYYNFFVSSFLTAFSVEHSTTLVQFILPVGISFYTFQTLSYSIDIYYKKLKPTNSILNFFSFVSFFPQLVAGPIERASNFLPQIEKIRTFNYANAILGCRFILYGFFKKVVISDNIAEMVNIIFAADSEFSGMMNLLGTILFAIQIYCDFSGYSDIAIGVAKLFNIDLMINFRRPYFARSLRDFWSRWHISLSTWFRDYVYIPLGGNKGSSYFISKNLLITFLVSGLWHGANWTFVVWGAIHGIFLVVERIAREKKIFAISGLDWFITIVIVLISWVFFRAENLSHALDFLVDMFSPDRSFLSQMQIFFARHSEITIGHTAIIFALTLAFFAIEYIIEKGFFVRTFNEHSLFRYSTYALMIFATILFGAFRNKIDFIYFQF